MQFDSESVWKARGRGFAMGVASRGGILVHLTGQVAWNNKEVVLGKGDVAEQTRVCFTNIKALLEEVGGTINDIVSLTTWYTAADQLPLIQSVRNEFFETGSEPVSNSIMVAGLGHRDFLAELTPVAVVPEHRFIEPQRSRT